MCAALIAGAARLPSLRHPRPETSTADLLHDVLIRALNSADVPLGEVDGLGVASFGLEPDRAVDLAWHVGIKASWVMDDPMSMNLFSHAVHAVESGAANAIAIVAGDRLIGQDYARLVRRYNVATEQYLRGVGPNARFSIITQEHMSIYGLTRRDYARVVLNQRRWARTNAEAAYQEPLSLEQYLSARFVAEPLSIFDCPPVVAGAEAVIVTAPSRRRIAQKVVKVRSCRGIHNWDNQLTSGLSTGLSTLSSQLWSDSGIGPEDLDVVEVYDNYPVVVLAQLQELGLIQDGRADRLLNPPVRPYVNTSGGLLSHGQAGAGGGLHGLVEAVLQLRGERGPGQVNSAKWAVVSAYGMLLYQHGGCAVAAVLEGA